MKLHPEDPRLTSYLLGELSAQDAELVATAIQNDPALAAAIAELEEARDSLAGSLDLGEPRLDREQRARILAAARNAEPKASPFSFANLKPYLAPVAAAAAIALVAAITWRSLHGPDAAIGASEPDATEAAESPGGEAGSVPLPALAERADFRKPQESPEMAIPVIGRQSGFVPIAKTIREDRKLPDPSKVRISSLLNSYQLRPEGPTVVARFPVSAWHPDNRSPVVTTHAATAATEVLPCPWKPSSVLVVISLRGNPSVDCEIEARFVPHTESVRRYRLLENRIPSGTATPSASHLLRAGESSLIALEVEASTASGSIGAIEWSANGRAATAVPVELDPSREPSNDARFAALLCAFGLWTANDRDAQVDAALVAALAREVAAEDLPTERTDFLILVDQAINL
ncbi:MAG: hypothetical protein H7A48_07185 [Akkermansiaceae bacterium]|nr:hypothetical protein [Akkermansiaceae bacterium]